VIGFSCVFPFHGIKLVGSHPVVVSLSSSSLSGVSENRPPFVGATVFQQGLVVIPEFI
jgi:hypothetical protein